MRNIKEILRLKSEGTVSIRQIAKAYNCSHSTVLSILGRATAVGLTYPVPPELTDSQLETMLYSSTLSKTDTRPLPDMQYINKELKRKGVTLQLLWEEYKEANPQGLMYSHYCEHYRQWRGQLDVSMRQEHRAGEKVFVDWAGPTIPVINPETGEIEPASLFIAVLGASNYSYVEACRSQGLEQWVDAHNHAFAYFGGIPAIIVPDNLRTGVDKSCYYEPTINQTYQEMANHYNTVVIPARVRKPKDKAKAEGGVLIAERWILAALRNQQFHHIAELNAEIKIKLEEMNNKPFQKMEGCRRSAFLSTDQPALKPLPVVAYEFAIWKKARVNIDYHVEAYKNFYSVPYQMVNKHVEIRITANIVEIIHNGQRLSSHQRAYGNRQYVTDHHHRPDKHQAYLEWTPERIVAWASSIGPITADFVQQLIASKVHPEQGYRACMGIIRLGKDFPSERIEKAAERAIACKAISYQNLKIILAKGLDPTEFPSEPTSIIVKHANIRGAKYYVGKAGLPLC